MTKPLTHQVITRARKIIDDECAWVQGCLAVFENGQHAHPHDPSAVRFCASGAMVRAGFELTHDIKKAYELRDAACARLLPKTPGPVYAVEDINDARHGHDAILRLFDEYLADG
jgi:hypothetical protein